MDKSVLSKHKLSREQLEKEMIGGKRDGSGVELAEKRKEFLNSSFWVPTSTPDAISATVAKPEKRPRSPMSGQPLKLKELISVKLLPDTDGEKVNGWVLRLCVCASTDLVGRALSCVQFLRKN